MDSSYLTTPIGASILESEPDDAPGCSYRDILDAQGRVGVEMMPGTAGNNLKYLFVFRSSTLKFNTSIEIFRILAHNDQINIFIAGTQPWIRFRGPKIG